MILGGVPIGGQRIPDLRGSEEPLTGLTPVESLVTDIETLPPPSSVRQARGLRDADKLPKRLTLTNARSLYRPTSRVAEVLRAARLAAKSNRK